MASEAPITSGQPVSRWTGRTDFSLINGRGWRVGSVTVAICSDHLTLRYENRTLAEIDRDQFRAWLIEPQSVLQVQGVTWFAQTGLTCISIDGLGSYVVPGNCVGQLAAVV